MSQEPGPEVQGVPVTAGNWQDPPVNRWAYWHVGEILPTYRVSRGDGPARELPRSPLADNRAAAGDVLAVAVTSAARHLQIVADLANVFNDSDAVDRIADATTADEVRGILEAA